MKVVCAEEVEGEETGDDEVEDGRNEAVVEGLGEGVVVGEEGEDARTDDDQDEEDNARNVPTESATAHLCKDETHQNTTIIGIATLCLTRCAKFNSSSTFAVSANASETPFSASSLLLISTPVPSSNAWESAPFRIRHSLVLPFVTSFPELHPPCLHERCHAHQVRERSEGPRDQRKRGAAEPPSLRLETLLL